MTDQFEDDPCIAIEGPEPPLSGMSVVQTFNTNSRCTVSATDLCVRPHDARQCSSRGCSYRKGREGRGGEGRGGARMHPQHDLST